MREHLLLAKIGRLGQGLAVLLDKSAVHGAARAVEISGDNSRGEAEDEGHNGNEHGGFGRHDIRCVWVEGRLG